MIILEGGIGDFFKKVGEYIIIYYGYYSSFIHSIVPSELGDLVEWVLNAAIGFLIIKVVATAAFKTRES